MQNREESARIPFHRNRLVATRHTLRSTTVVDRTLRGPVFRFREDQSGLDSHAAKSQETTDEDDNEDECLPQWIDHEIASGE